MVVGRSEFSSRAAQEALPMRDAFAVLFFVSVGMLFDPRFPFQYPGLTLATLGVILLGKPLAAMAIVLGLGYPPKVGLAVAVALAQIGEFSFILAALGMQLNLLSDVANNALVAGAIVSITINPLLYRLVDPAEAWAARRPRLWKWLNRRVTQTMPSEAAQAGAAEHRAVVVGYGPVGQSLVRLLRENEIEPTIIEMNLETVRKLREQGMAAVYGDARHRETLKEAGVSNAGSLILSSAGLQGTPDIIRAARELNPAVRVLARAAYVREMPALRQAGADRIFSGEGEVALAFTEALLQELGATPDQIDRERERVREELFGPPLLTDNPQMSATPLRPKTEVKVGAGAPPAGRKE
jgi:CPA2 family monovalent cation:H+ antiporter-2